MKRGKSLQRRAPLRRKTIMRSKRRSLTRLEVDIKALVPRRGADLTAYARRQRAMAYMGWVKSLPCMLGGSWALADKTTKRSLCRGVVEADHAGDRRLNGAFRKAPDSTCIPLCVRHHRERTASTSCRSGAFADHHDTKMRRWCDDAIALVQRLAVARGVEVPDDGGRVAAAQAPAKRVDTVPF